MPEPPPVNALVRWTLENPWPLAVALAGVAGVLLWRLVRAGRDPGEELRAYLLAASPLVPAIIVFLVASLVETSGERARKATITLVDRAIAGDESAVEAIFAPNATLHIGSPRNAGSDMRDIIDRLRDLHDRREIVSNRITHLRGYTESRDRATVHLSCSTDAGWGPTLSRWVLHFEKLAAAEGGDDPDDLRASRIVWISLNGRPPPAGAW